MRFPPDAASTPTNGTARNARRLADLEASFSAAPSAARYEYAVRWLERAAPAVAKPAATMVARRSSSSLRRRPRTAAISNTMAVCTRTLAAMSAATPTVSAVMVPTPGSAAAPAVAAPMAAVWRLARAMMRFTCFSCVRPGSALRSAATRAVAA